MMKISTRVEYGLIALADIAINCKDGKTDDTVFPT